MLCHVDENEILLCEEETTPRQHIPCDITVWELCNIIIDESGLRKPLDSKEAKELYIQLRDTIRTNLAGMI